MLLEELQKLVAAGESENLEFKKTTGQRIEAAKTFCALLNGLGGFLLFGVSDRRLFLEPFESTVSSFSAKIVSIG